ncbi:MAG: hypothetical protein DRO40_01975 [Thermoprotei archaeon]|nr:MAG: hypothetical protein DRO40_01975 [Thermoprotei archaeon]
MDTNKAIVVFAKQGNIVMKRIVDGDLIDILKKVAIEALQKWDPSNSNFDIIRYDYKIEKKLPLKPEEVDIILKLNPIRLEGSVVFTLPIYIISYKNYSTDEGTVDEEVYVVAPYISDEYVGYVEEVAIMTTSPSEESM